MEHLKFNGIKVENNSEAFYTIENSKSDLSNNFYFLSNDVFKMKTRFFRSDEDSVVVGIANPHFFHIIAEIINLGVNTKRIIAVDYNYDQLVHFNNIRKNIIQSKNRIEFVENLFKVKFGTNALSLLNNFQINKYGYVHGGLEQDNLFDLEKKLWNDIEFNEKAFEDAYGLKPIKEKAGLKINSNTIGDINTYYATILCASKKEYDLWPFTLAFGTGFLRNEEIFRQMQELLLKTPVYQIHADISLVYEDILLSNRYNSIFFWSSNVLCDYFVQKHKPLEQIIDLSIKYGTQKEPLLPEIDLMLLQDERTKICVPKQIDNYFYHKRKWSVHTHSFAKVNKWLEGKRNLEIVTEKNWIIEDKGISKLPNTEYILVENFEKLEENIGFYDSIFIHIIVGHGVTREKLRNIVHKAKKMSRNVVLLEHNAKSKDFKKHRIGLTVEEIREMFGRESNLEFCRGYKSRDRNILCVYKKGLL